MPLPESREDWILDEARTRVPAEATYPVLAILLNRITADRSSSWNALGEDMAVCPAIIDKILYAPTDRHLYDFGDSQRE